MHRACMAKAAGQALARGTRTTAGVLARGVPFHFRSRRISNSMAFKHLTNERWQHYQSTILLPTPDPIDLDRARCRIERAIRAYSKVEEQREMRRLSVDHSNGLRKGRSMLAAFKRKLAALKEQSPSAKALKAPPDTKEFEGYFDYLQDDQATW